MNGADLTKALRNPKATMKKERLWQIVKKRNNMEYRRLGGMDVSAIGLGCLPMVGYYGGKYEKKDMIALIRRAYEQGVTFFDTAEV